MSELNYRVYLSSRPGINGVPCVANFGYEIWDYPHIREESSLLLETMYLSVDPYMRCRMNENSGVDYAKAWEIGETITGSAVGLVVESTCEKFNKGDVVTSVNLSWPWQKFVVLGSDQVQNITDTIPNKQWSLALGLFGVTGLTGAIGIMEKGGIQPGLNQAVVVSGAAGACGSTAGQVAKIIGCGKLVGICGTKEKCSFLTNTLNFDGAICYKTENTKERLATMFPSGIDVYFDNVGGEISDDVISHMNPNSNIVLCGQISTYNKDIPYPPPLDGKSKEIVATRSIARERFLVLSYAHQFKSTLGFLSKAYSEGKLINRETISHGLQNAGKSFVDMMLGENFGKQIVKL